MKKTWTLLLCGWALLSDAETIDVVTLIDFDVHTAEAVAEKPPAPKRPTGKYPEAKANGVMPAYGLFARDVDGLTLSGKMVFRDEAGRGRKALVFEDVKDLNDTGAHQ